MGYELKCMLGTKHDKKGLPKGIKFYFIKIATVDLCKCVVDNGGIENLLNRKAKRGNAKLYPRACFFSQGDDCVIKDHYDDDLRLIAVQEVLDAMIADNKVEPYRRFTMTIPLLKNAIKGFGKGVLYCILFGH